MRIRRRGIMIITVAVILSFFACKQSKKVDNQAVLPPSYPGHFLDFIELSDYVVLQNQEIKIFLFKDQKYSTDIAKTLTRALYWVEDFSGINNLRKNDNSIYPAYLAYEDLQAMSPEVRYLNLFNEIANYDDKIVFFANRYDLACAFENSITMFDDYFVIESYDCYEFGAFLHELIHVNHSRYAPNIGYCPPFMEGYASWGVGRIAQKQGLDALYRINQEQYAIASLPENLEDFFAGAYQKENDISNNYYYGYAFCLYLEEIYGEEIFIKIFDASQNMDLSVYYSEDGSQDNWHLVARDFVEVIKAQCSASVFNDCVTWYNSR